MGKKGRPTKQVQIQIVKEIRPFFEKSYSATFTANKTGYDIKTVCKYFNEFASIIVENEDKEFIQRQKESKELAIQDLDNFVYQEYELLSEVEHEIQKAKKDKKPIPKHLLTTKFMILREICEAMQQKFGLCMVPPIDDELKKYVEKLLNNAGK